MASYEPLQSTLQEGGFLHGADSLQQEPSVEPHDLSPSLHPNIQTYRSYDRYQKGSSSLSLESEKKLPPIPEKVTYWRGWRWEAFACLLGLVSFAAIVITLYPYEGKPVPQLPYKISINSLLSVEAVALKASLIFAVASCIGQLQWTWFSSERPLHDLVRYDEAGRGAWGSLRLLWAQRLRQPLVALGALVTILAVAIDPMIQQLVRPIDCEVPLGVLEAKIPRTNMFEEIDSPTFVQDVKAAIIAGVFSPGKEIAAQCSTGNCTFLRTYGTLGYCSSCVDSTHEMRFNNTCSNRNGTMMKVLEKITDEDGCPSLPMLQITTSLDSGLSTTYSVKFGTRDGQEFINVGTMGVLPLNQAGRLSVQILVGKTYLSDTGRDSMSGLRMEGCKNGTDQDTWRCRGYAAATCTLQPCVRLYNATSVRAGRLVEQEIGRSDPMVWGGGSHVNSTNTSLAVLPPSLSLVDTHCITSQEQENLRARVFRASDSPYANESSRWLPFLEASTLKPNGSSLLSRGCLYQISNKFATSMSEYALSNQFDGQIQAADFTNELSDLYSMTSFNGSQILQHIYNFGNFSLERIQTTFSNISDSLTEYIRTHGNETCSKPAMGIVLHYAICLEVRWAWMAFPAAVVVLTLVFVSAVMLDPARMYKPLWKSSILAWIFCGPAGLASQSHDPAYNSPDGMNDKAKQVVVRLATGPDKRIRQVDLSGREVLLRCQHDDAI